MKIALDIQPLLDMEKTGIGYYTDNIVRGLIQGHPEAEFVLESFAFRNNKEVKKRIKRYEAENTKNKVCFFPRAVHRTLSALTPLPYNWFFNGRPDIRHFFNFMVPPFVRGKTVVTIHDLTFRRFPETVNTKTLLMLRVGLERSLKRADLVVAVSEFTRQEILTFYDIPAEKIKVIPNSVDLEVYKPGILPAEEIRRVCGKYGIPGEYILYLGTLEPRKNVERLVGAYDLARKGHTDFPRLVITGRNGWMYNGIFKQVTDRNLENSVMFTGYVAEEDKPGLYSGARCFCFPSLYEGFGLPPLEAMACGTPVMAANAASLPEVVGGAGVLVDPHKVESIASGMERLCYDSGLCAELQAKGPEQAKRFEWRGVTEKLYAAYEELIIKEETNN